MFALLLGYVGMEAGILQDLQKLQLGNEAQEICREL